MKTNTIKVDSENVCPEELKDASNVIRLGGIVAFPTETVYGLGADALDSEASKKIYQAKGRPSDNPLIVHIAEFDEMLSIAKVVPKKAFQLAEAFWPGPLTMIVNKNDKVPYETTGGMDTVAVRMPAHPVARALIKESGRMLAAPSANTSGRPSPTCAKHVLEDMDGKIPMIIDGGEVEIGIESTIVDLTEEEPMVLRPGYITVEMLESVIGKVRMDPGLMEQDCIGKPKAPGMKYKHYAPHGELTIVNGEEEKVVKKINELTDDARNRGIRVGIIGTDETKLFYRGDTVLSMGSRQDEDSIAKHLYQILREFDEAGVDVIYSESFQTPRIGQAIMNRLLKAAGHKVITV